jgi:hypothetical protein
MANQDYDRLVTLRISNYQGQIIANNGKDQLGADFIDLNGFAFLQFTVLTATKVKTMKGCSVKINSNGPSLEIPSDTEEIESDFSHELNIGILDFDIDLEDDVLGFVNEHEVSSIHLAFDKTGFEFNEINHDLLQKIMEGQFQEELIIDEEE